MFQATTSGDPVVKPGDPAHSELMQRITSADPVERMPPADSKLSLSPAEVELFRRWIDQGAEYPSDKHWAFDAVKPVAVPQNGTAHPIDAFINARLAQEKSPPTAEAPRETLIRRLALDFTGLPPTLAEIDAYLADQSPEAFDKVVAHYLGAPAYGEQMATDWMDLARFADTYGYQSDADRDMSPWRDWVIRAFNENLPYNQFIEWQIAGDLFPKPTRDQYLATAFNRLHRQTNEGGSIEEEWRVEYVADRVHTLGTAFLGLTLECCRCHDHKYDPIRQTDYYKMFAFFNSIDESGLYAHFTRATPTPTLFLYEPGVEEQHAALLKTIAAKQAELTTLRESSRPEFEKWKAGSQGKIEPVAPSAAYPFDVVTAAASPNAVTGGPPAALAESPELVPGQVGQALQFSGDNSVVCRGAGAFHRTDPFSFSLWLKPTILNDRAVVFHRSRSWTDSGSRGYQLLLEQGRPSFALIHFYPGNAIEVRAKEPLPVGAWSHLTITYDGSSRSAGVALYLNGQPLVVETVHDHLYRDIQHRSEWGDSEVGGIELTLAGRFRDSGFKQGLVDEFQVWNRWLTPLEARLSSSAAVPAAGSESGSDDWLTQYLHRHDARYQVALAELQQARKAEDDLVTSVREIMVMRELPQPKPTFVLKRGQYTDPGERVEPGTPEGIFPFPADLPRNRLGLAKWLVDRRNPLTARVVVNRIWRMHFGRGLVATQEDFGSQGKSPTHPELLDWLAGWFMDHAWDIKAMHRLIVTSAAYRRLSHASAVMQQSDPENHLLARGPRHRLSAEQIRDSALAVSGLLAQRIGGPSVKPYQPAGLWEESGTHKSYAQDHGENLYRRSLYTFWRRTAPPPSMLTFDATSREVCTAKRDTTSTPLQALVLLNDPQYIEASRILAERLVKSSPTEIPNLIETAFRLITGRRPAEKEREILSKLHGQQLRWFIEHPADATKYLAIGEKKRDETLSAPDVAATAVLINALMNHDEFVVKR